MQDTQHIAQLLQKSLAGSLSPAENAELRAWVNSDSVYQQLLDRLHDGDSLEKLLLLRHELEQERESYPTRLQETLSARIAGSQHGKSRTLHRWLPYVAAAFIIATTITWVLLGDKNSGHTPIAESVVNVTAGTNRATLTLADGREISLSETQNGIVVGNKDITYNDGASLATISTQEKHDPMILELETPRGGTYQITLPDGSKAWLNAETILKYPSRFNEDERIVELQGEAYFEIKARQTKKGTGSDMVPFKVLTRGQEVEVLGTEFNISAYPEESESKTTLVEGSVRVANLKTQNSKLLIPGQQAIINQSAIHIHNVDVSQFIAWKNGFFYFDRIPTKTAIAQLARWYDLEVVYEKKVPDANIFAYIDRSKPLSAVLKALEKSGLNFRVIQSKGRKQLVVSGEQD